MLPDDADALITELRRIRDHIEALEVKRIDTELDKIERWANGEQS